MSEEASEIIFYRLPPTWGLPSLSPACIQVQAYLQLAGIQHSVEDCASASISPTGHVPALEWGQQLIGEPDGAAGGFDTARIIIRQLRSEVRDLDADLSDAQRAEALAFTALVGSGLEAATVYTTWAEPHSYSTCTREAYGAALPTPLNRYIPWRARRAVLQRFAGTTAQQVYAEAAAVYKALDQRLQSSSASSASSSSSSRSGFFFGDKPSSLDALLFGHLLYQQSAPASAPELRSELAKYPALGSYLSRLARACEATVPRPPPARREDWRRDEPSRNGGPARLTEKEKQQRRRSMYWLAGAVGAIVLYVVVGGQYISFGLDYDEDEEELDE